MQFDDCVDVFKGVSGRFLFYGFDYFHNCFVNPIRLVVVRLDSIFCRSMALLILVKVAFHHGIFDVDVFCHIGDILFRPSFVVSLPYSTNPCAVYWGEAGGVVTFYQLFFSFAKICTVYKFCFLIAVSW